MSARTLTAIGQAAALVAVGVLLCVAAFGHAQPSADTHVPRWPTAEEARAHQAELEQARLNDQVANLRGAMDQEARR